MGKPKSWPCDMCEKIYTKRQNLQRHKDSKHGKAVQCSKCGKCIKWKNYLAKHEAKCSGKSVTVCGVCGKKFSYAWYLKRHMLQAHADDKEQCSYKCLKCNQVFVRIHYYKKHVESCVKQPISKKKNSKRRPRPQLVSPVNYSAMPDEDDYVPSMLDSSQVSSTE